MQAAKLANLLNTRTKHQVIGIAQQNFNPKLFQHILRNALHCGLRANRHEDGGLDSTVRSEQVPAPRSAVVGRNFESKRHAEVILTERRRSTPCFVHNVEERPFMAALP